MFFLIGSLMKFDEVGEVDGVFIYSFSSVQSLGLFMLFMFDSARGKGCDLDAGVFQPMYVVWQIPKENCQELERHERRGVSKWYSKLVKISPISLRGRTTRGLQGKPAVWTENLESIPETRFLIPEDRFLLVSSYSNQCILPWHTMDCDAKDLLVAKTARWRLDW